MSSVRKIEGTRDLHATVHADLAVALQHGTVDEEALRPGPGCKDVGGAESQKLQRRKIEPLERVVSTYHRSLDFLLLELFQASLAKRNWGHSSASHLSLEFDQFECSGWSIRERGQLQQGWSSGVLADGSTIHPGRCLRRRRTQGASPPPRGREDAGTRDAMLIHWQVCLMGRPI